jgi:hypothetical protein
MKILEAIIAVIKAMYEAGEAAFLERWAMFVNRLRPKNKRPKYTETDPRVTWTPSPGLIKGFRIAILSIATVIILVAGLAAWRSATRHPLDQYVPMFLALGNKLGQEARSISSSRDQVVAIVPEITSNNRRFVQTQINACESAVEKDGIVTFAGTWPLPKDTSGSRGPTGTQLESVMKEFHDPAVIISFVGTPQFTPAELARWKPGRPHLIVVDEDPQYDTLNGLIASNIVSVAITPRVTKEKLELTAKDSLDDWFNRHYMATTRESVGQLKSP